MTPRERAEAVKRARELMALHAPGSSEWMRNRNIVVNESGDVARDLIAAEEALAASRAEAERLRGALDTIAAEGCDMPVFGPCDDGSMDVVAVCHSCASCLARAALAPATEGT